MQHALKNHRETALESPYSEDRKDAIKSLSELYSSVDDDGKRKIIETLRTVGTEATGREERRLAVEQVETVFQQNPALAGPIVVSFFCELAADGKTSDTRVAAIDTLRELYPDVDAAHQDTIGSTLSEIAGDATYEDERQRARQRLSDIAAENDSTSDTTGHTENNTSHVGYLGISLADHLANSVDESPEACEQRAKEVSDFLSENPVSDSAFDDVQDDVDRLVEQLDVIPTDGGLDEERKEQVRSLATRIKHLYQR